MSPARSSSTTPSSAVDVLVIGGGIVGLATAYRLRQQLPTARLALVEKETAVARHQSGRNSGVLHSGIYYPPGSLKADNCRKGRAALIDFCQRERLPFEICGKVIVAVDAGEIAALERLHQRGRDNAVDCTLIDGAGLGELEPAARGVRALHVPSAGIVDFPAVCARLAERLAEGEVAIHLGARVVGIGSGADGVRVTTSAGAFAARVVVNCAGLHSDRVAALAGDDPPARIVPFRGEYFHLRADAVELVRNLIYPVPDPRFPFLGVHLTRTLHGGVHCGPNAVFALAREGYRWGTVDLGETAAALLYPGFRRLIARYWRTGLGEMWRSWSKTAFVRAAQRLVPALRREHLLPAPAGVRAQAVRADGTLVDDFLVVEHGRVVSVVNAPSPAATASLHIGAQIAERVAARMASN